MNMRFKFLFMFFMSVVCATAFSQQSTVSGVVTDSKDNSPMPGVNVIIEGTTTGAVTGINGEYSIKVEKSDAVLVASFIGYTTQKITVGNQSVINFKMSEDIKSLDEVVVVGYGVSKKKDITGSVSSIKSEDLKTTGITSPEQMLQGKLTGVRIISNNGEPGAGVNITVRGVSSVTAGMQPLYVVDGIPLDGRSTSPSGVTSAPATSPLNFLNPNDIESIDVLKDASAAAIYGSRGAGGVILITTKKGKEGKSEITYSGNFSMSELPKKLEVLSADEWRQYRIDNQRILRFTGDDLSDYGASTDWQDQIFRTAYSQDHNLSLSGGNSKSSYRASLNYTNQEGIIKNSDLTKYIGRLNLTQKGLKDRLTVETNLTLSSVNENRVPVGATGSEGDIIVNALTSNPTLPVYDSVGNPIQTENAGERFPSTVLAYYRDLTRTANMLGGVTASLEIIKNLTLKTNVGMSYSNARRLINQSEKLLYLSSSADNSAQVNETELYNYLLEHTLNYNLTKDIHSIGFLAGYSYQDFTRYGTNMYAGGFTTDGITYTDNLGSAARQKIFSSPDNYKMQSFFGRINYSLMDKYIVTATIRRDGSTKFGKNKRYGDFPSLSFAWRLGEESFIKNANIFTNLKVRAGWGLTGNSDIGTKNTQANFRPAPENLALIGGSALAGFSLARTSNTRLQWEATETYNAGLDFAILKGRLSGTVDVFRKTSNNLLLEIPSPPGSPTSTVVKNLDSTKIINNGLELLLTVVPVSTKDINWEISGNISFLSNMVKGLPVKQYVTGSAQGPGVQGSYVEVITNDKSIGQFQGSQVDSIGYDGRIYYVRNWNNRKDSSIFLGCALPKFTWSITNNFKFKSFDLSVFIEGVHGNKIFNNTALIADKTNIRTARNALKYFVDDNTSLSQPSTKISNRYIEDGSYIRLSNATLGYTFKFNDNSLIKNFKVFVSGSNLFLITDYKGYDPDVASDRAIGSVKSHGIDLTTYPKARTYSVGLNMTF